MSTSTSTSDRIEKKIRLRHPRSRVWKALSDSEEFGKWFGAAFDGPFQPGARVGGRITHKGYEHLTMEVTIERIEPERLLSWRWRPGAPPEEGEGVGHETPTLVVFELEEVEGGTLLTVVESGFDQIPIARREKAFRENEQGWEIQMKAIEAHLGGS